MKYPYHHACTYIMPGRMNKSRSKQWAERTHGCWCSSWKLEEDGTWKVWRDGRWQKPKRGELRFTHKLPPAT